MSDEKKSNSSKSGIGLCGGVFLVFLILKFGRNWRCCKLVVVVGYGSVVDSFRYCYFPYLGNYPSDYSNNI